jgi:hypothetical protein
LEELPEIVFDRRPDRAGLDALDAGDGECTEQANDQDHGHDLDQGESAYA